MDNLARDVALAEKLGYGCHYGRFKAVYPNTMDRSIEDILGTGKAKRVKAKTVEVPETRKCKGCGREMVPGPYNKLYCDEDCKRYHYEKRKRERRKDAIAAGRFCVQCGKPVISGRHYKYCSDQCCEEAERERYELTLARSAVERKRKRMEAEEA